MGPHKVPVTFPVHSGAQMSALKVEDASSRRIIPSNKGVFVVGAFGYAQPQKIAKVRCWLLGKEKAIGALIVLGHFPTNLLGLDLPKRKVWTDEEGKNMDFWERKSLSMPTRCCLKSSSLPSNQYQALSLALGSKYRSPQLLTT